MTVRILVGDCRAILKTLPDESVHCVVTSPPYWGLRDYGVDGQLGMERSLGEYIETMVDAFREVRRVMRMDATLWLNLGDSYAASPNGRKAADIMNDDRTFRDKPFSTIGPVYDPTYEQTPRSGKTQNQGNTQSAGFLKPKDLCGIPWRLAMALQADGWWLRQDIIWSKPNPMPESVKDRCTKAHEYIFLMSKSGRYYYDAHAIREPHSRDWSNGKCGGTLGPGGEKKIVPTNKGDPNFRNGHSQWERKSYPESNPIGANKRSVWEIATAPFADAHFATFPPALIEPCILAGCPVGGTVLDPFGGAGTTGLVADRLRRDAILIELNPDYVAMADRRIRDDAGMFAEVMAR